MTSLKKTRASGILFPVSSLASPCGIGCFSKEAYDFIDFLEESGQKYWQVLPFNPTGFGDSPYASNSAFAGNPYFIDFRTLHEEGLLETWEYENRNWGGDPVHVDYGALYENRRPVLYQAFERFYERMLRPEAAELSGTDAAERESYEAFLTEESGWLEDYCLFMSLKFIKYGGKPWQEWEETDRRRKPAAMETAARDYAKEIAFNRFLQYEFMKQWKKIRAYAAEKGIEIIGDAAFYVAMDSADSWSHPENYKFDEDLVPSVVAGTPPDAFSAEGQRWGNPVYDWDAQKKTGYAWWMERIRRCYRLFDVLRFDHFHGFDTCYEIPVEAESAKEGTPHKGPGMDFFRVMKKEFPEAFAEGAAVADPALPGAAQSDTARSDGIADTAQSGGIRVIAEDLGINTPSKEKLLADSGFPGMKILQFAFDWTESSVYLPYQHIRNCVVYTGTHDNPTARAWIESISDHDRDYVRRYIHSENTDYGAFVWDFIREAFRSPADLCIIPLQDYLVMGNEARINTPGAASGNWQWRLRPNFLSADLARSIRKLTELYGRLNILPEQDETEAEPAEE